MQRFLFVYQFPESVLLGCGKVSRFPESLLQG